MTAWDVAALRFAGAFLTVLPIVLWRGPPRIAPAGRWRCSSSPASASRSAPSPATSWRRRRTGRPSWRPGCRWARRCSASPSASPGSAAGAPSACASWWRAACSSRRPPAAAWEGAWKGDLLFLAAVLSWSVYTVLVQRWRLPALDAMLAIGLAAAPVYLPVWWLVLPSTIGQAPPAAVASRRCSRAPSRPCWPACSTPRP